MRLLDYWGWIGLGVGAVCVGPMWAHGSILTTAMGDGADAYVQQGDADSNFGSDTELLVKSGADGNNRKGYIRFDLSSLTGPVDSAELILPIDVDDGGGAGAGDPDPQAIDFHVYALNDGTTAGDGYLGDGWSESAITWNNAPASNSTGSNPDEFAQAGTGTADGGQATLLGSFSIDASSGDAVALMGSAGSPLVNFLNADTNQRVTFIITRAGFVDEGGTPTPNDGSVNAAFSTKETGTLPPPSLYINQTLTTPRIESVDSDATWRVTSTQPGTGWNTSLTYDDSDAAGWQNTENPYDRNIWETSDSSDDSPSTVWIRHTFYIDEPITNALANFGFDDDGELYINGVLIEDDHSGAATQFNNMWLNPSLFVQGENLIAMEGINVLPPDNSVNLEIDFNVVPEPASATLVTGSLALLAIRRRRYDPLLIHKPL